MCSIRISSDAVWFYNNCQISTAMHYAANSDLFISLCRKRFITELEGRRSVCTPLSYTVGQSLSQLVSLYLCTQVMLRWNNDLCVVLSSWGLVHVEVECIAGCQSDSIICIVEVRYNTRLPVFYAAIKELWDHQADRRVKTAGWVPCSEE